jgi:hypothetical protein
MRHIYSRKMYCFIAAVVASRSLNLLLLLGCALRSRGSGGGKDFCPSITVRLCCRRENVWRGTPCCPLTPYGLVGNLKNLPPIVWLCLAHPPTDLPGGHVTHCEPSCRCRFRRRLLWAVCAPAAVEVDTVARLFCFHRQPPPRSGCTGLYWVWVFFAFKGLVPSPGVKVGGCHRPPPPPFWVLSVMYTGYIW